LGLKGTDDENSRTRKKPYKARQQAYQNIKASYDGYEPDEWRDEKYSDATRSVESWMGKTKINMEGANRSDVDANGSGR
jgi:hypothetical protein